MNILSTQRVIALCFSFALTFLLRVNAQSATIQTVSYTVKQGETIMSIARQYDLPLSKILEYNPNINPDYVQAGQKIFIPISQNGEKSQLSERTLQERAPDLIIDEYKPIITYREYKVKRKDTAYSLAKANHITVEELMSANPSLNKNGNTLKKGSIIRIPIKIYPPKPQYQSLSPIRISILLPFIGNGIENERSVEFYRGMLMGIEEWKQLGKDIIVNAYNEPNPDMSIAQLMNEITAQKPDVIVGPLYPSHFNDVIAVSSKQRKIAIPFSSKVPQLAYKENVFVINTPSTYETEFQTNLFCNTFNKNYQIVFFSTDKATKKDFCQTLEKKLPSNTYRVIHTKLSNNAEQIVPLLKKQSKGAVLLIPDDDSESTLNQLLQISQQLREELPNYNISIVGYENWINLADIGYKNKLHAADTYIFASNYYFPYTSASLTFNTLYERWFKTSFLNCKPRMAPLGYDFGRIFIGGLITYGYDFGTESPKSGTPSSQTKLQTDLRFARVKGGGFVNRSMWLIHFKEDLSIVKISSQ